MSEDKRAANESAPPATPQSSMQDIIKSISRIIDEDNRVAPSPPIIPRDRDKHGVLELTEVVEADGSLRRLDGSGAAAAQPGHETLSPAVATQKTTAPSAVAAPPQPEEGRDHLLSAATSEAAIAAFGRLEAAATEQRPAPGPALGPGSRTLEDIVRDALRPLLQVWLDQHLPDLVERLVQEEIRRLVRDARLR
jgi:cell pole-organizing protein PopZ